MKNFNWTRFFGIIIPYFIVVSLFQFIGYSLVGISLSTPDIEPNSGQRVVTTFFTLLGTIIILLVFMRWVDKEPFIKLGLHWKHKSKDLLMGILLGIGVMCFGYLLLIALDSIVFEKVNFSGVDILYAILVFVFVSFSEELLLRGYVLKNFASSFNKYLALVLSALIFALMHGANPNISIIPLVNLFLAGILLGVSFIYTKNLWFPIGLHFSWNLFQTFFGFNVSGKDFYSVIEFQTVGSDLITGGDFGFEGSVLAIIVQVILITFLIPFFERRERNSDTEKIETISI